MTGVIQLSAHMTPTGALKTLRRELEAESNKPAILQDVPLIGTGRLEIRISDAPKDPRIPSQLTICWAVMELYVTDGKVVREELKRMGLKATEADAFAEASACKKAFQIERGV
jgi:hypothetical protein